jgi:hypothetical protein
VSERQAYARTITFALQPVDFKDPQYYEQMAGTYARQILREMGALLRKDGAEVEFDNRHSEPSLEITMRLTGKRPDVPA